MVAHYTSCIDCCVVLCCSYLVSSGGVCSCMLLLHSVLTSADAGPDLSTLCPNLYTLRLWCCLPFNRCKHSTCTGLGCYQLQLVLVVLFLSSTSADSPLAHMVVSPCATYTGGVLIQCKVTSTRMKPY